MSERELRPCDCGAHPVHHQFSAGDGKRIAAQVRCPDCGAESNVVVRDTVLDTGRSVVRAWNRQHPLVKEHPHD